MDIAEEKWIAGEKRCLFRTLFWCCTFRSRCSTFLIGICAFSIIIATFYSFQINSINYGIKWRWSENYDELLSSDARIPWDTCCRGIKDVCGRKNCTGVCSTPSISPFIDKSGENAFFWETSGRRASPNDRQACAVESLARLNPHLKVYVMMTTESIDRTTSTMKALNKYDNIYPIQIDLDEFMVYSPLDHWYFCTDWRTGKYNVSHLSDGLRFLTLSKYGGYYFDLDFVLMKSLVNRTNFVAAESKQLIGSSALHFDSENPFIHEAVEDFHQNYKKDVFVHNGPGLLTRLLIKSCKVANITSMFPSGTCPGASVYTPKSFFSIYWSSWKNFFDKRKEDDIVKWDDEMLGAHLWNKLSYNATIYKNSNQLYVQMARSFCPNVFSTAPDKF